MGIFGADKFYHPFWNHPLNILLPPTKDLEISAGAVESICGAVVYRHLVCGAVVFWVVLSGAFVCHVVWSGDVVCGALVCGAVECGPRGCWPVVCSGVPPVPHSLLLPRGGGGGQNGSTRAMWRNEKAS